LTEVKMTDMKMTDQKWCGSARNFGTKILC